MSNYDKIRFIPLDELETPKTGYQAMVGYYWIIKDGFAMAYCRLGNKDKVGMPQCNASKDVAYSIRDQVYPEAVVLQVPVAYWPLELY